MRANIKNIQITDEKIFKIGIDKVVLYNFDFPHNMKNIKIDSTKIINVKEYTHKTIIKDKLCEVMNVCYLTNEENKIKENYYNILTFNPNKILYNNNIQNATPKEVNQALEKIKKHFENKDIDIDFANSKIKEIEININIPVDFLEFKEVFRALLKPFGKWEEISGFNQSEKLKEITELESLFIKINNSSILRIYDKTKESEFEAPKISRVEFSIKKSTLDYYFKKIGKENNINTLLENENIIKNIFKEKINKIFQQTLKHIENKKKLLQREYIAFKKTSVFALAHGRCQKRGVYNYLEKFDIFDYNILIEIIKECGNSNIWRETQIIKKKFSHLNNMEKLNYLIEFIEKQ